MRGVGPRRGWRRLLGLSLAAALLAGLGGLLALPELLERFLVQRLEERLGVPVRIADVDFNVFTGGGHVEALVIGARAGGDPLLRLPGLTLDLSMLALARGRLVASSATLHRPQLAVVRSASGELNVVEAFGGGGEPLGFTIERLEVQEGTLTYVDHAAGAPVERIVGQIDLRTGRLSSEPVSRSTPTEFELTARLAGGVIRLAGTATLLGGPERAEVTARVEGVEASLLEPYLPDRPRVDATAARLDATVRYELTPEAGGPRVHQLAGTVELGPTRLRGADGQAPLLEIAGVTARDVVWDLAARAGVVGELALVEPRLRVVRDEAGAINLASLAGDQDARSAGAPSPDRPEDRPGPATPAGSLEIRRAHLAGGTVEFVDRTTRPAVATSLGDVRLTLTDLDLTPGAAPATVLLTGRLDGGAEMRVQGTVRPRPFRTELELRVAGLRPGPFQPYAELWLGPGSVREGLADLRLDLAAGSADDGPMTLEFGGRVAARGLALRAPDRPDPVFRARQLVAEIERIRVVPELEADVAAVRLDGAILRVERARDGELAPLWRAPEGPARSSRSPQQSEPRAGPGSPLRIRQAEVRDSRIELVDRTTTPPFAGTLAVARGVVRQIGEPRARAAFELRGTLDQAPLSLRGSFDARGRAFQLDAEATVSGYPLARLDPYTTQYLGYRIRRGQATAAAEYRRDREGLEADHLLRIRRLQLGPQVNDTFQARVGVPLELALALLEDPDGEIQLRLPIRRGTGLQAEVGDIAWRTLGNTLAKAVGTPFRVLRAVATAGGRIGRIAVEPVDFLPGTREPDAEGLARLGDVATLLGRRPRLELELRGVAAQAEREALARARLRARLEAVEAPSPEAALAELHRRTLGEAATGGETPAEMEEALVRRELASVDLAELARDRAAGLKERLVRRGVPAERLFVREVGGVVADGPRGRVEFELLP